MNHTHRFLVYRRHQGPSGPIDGDPIGAVETPYRAGAMLLACLKYECAKGERLRIQECVWHGQNKLAGWLLDLEATELRALEAQAVLAFDSEECGGL